MSLWTRIKRRIWREPTREEIEKLLLDRLDLELSLRRVHALAREEFVPIGPVSPNAALLDRRKDYEEYFRLSDAFLGQWGHKLTEDE
jgi:hypothetical protein